MSIKEQLVQELKRLSEPELAEVARYVSSLKHQARVGAARAIDEQMNNDRKA